MLFILPNFFRSTIWIPKQIPVDPEILWSGLVYCIFSIFVYCFLIGMLCVTINLQKNKINVGKDFQLSHKFGLYTELFQHSASKSFNILTKTNCKSYFFITEIRDWFLHRNIHWMALTDHAIRCGNIINNYT